ncbi:molybdopterin-binding protein [Chloroflexota bacterium]
MTELRLLEKTELFIENIHLSHVNLDQVARAVAGVLEINPRDAAVIDVRPGVIAVDILRATVNLEQILGKREALLLALSAVEGLTVTDETTIHSEGILGLVNVDEARSPRLTTGINRINRQIVQAIRSRAIVFPTGEEIIQGNIEDTNTSYLVALLSDMGYKATGGTALADSFDGVVGALRQAADRGYGLVITTGGVGAEDKDHLVEAILALDTEAAAPYIVHYTQGHGRHKKDGVRIAVGRLDWTTYVALPGPHDEVQLAAPVLVQGLYEQWDKALLAEKLALPLRAKLLPQ